jgi:DedD protein
MRRALDPEHDLIGDDEAPRDLVLGIPALLGIFVAAVLICAVCFGYGYSSGHGLHFPSALSAQRLTPPPPATAPLASQTSTVAQPDTDSNQLTSRTVSDSAAQPMQDAAPASAKPNPGMAYQASSDSSTQTNPVPMQKVAAAQMNRPAEIAPQGNESTRRTAESALVAQAHPSVPALGRSASASPAATTAQPNGGSAAQTVGTPIALMVQVAAVTQFSDAQTLSTALRHDGFSPIVKTTTGDPYFHVQVGPFSSYEAAKAMKQRLTTNGYSAFIRR